MKLPHEPPPGFEYWIDDHNKTIKRIWIRNLSQFSYRTENPSSIWGFYHIKKKEFIAPINFKKPGKVVNIRDTSPYSAMKKNINPLMAAFL
jgi:hypothetical protein